MLIFWTVWLWRHLRCLTRGLIGKMKERVTDQRQRLNEGPKKCPCFAVCQYDSLALVRALFLSKKSRKVTQVQSWPKKFVLGCVIPPAGVVARSRNLGHTFWPSLYKDVATVIGARMSHWKWRETKLQPIKSAVA